MLWQNVQAATVELTWSFYGPVLIFVLFCALGVPVWAAIGACAVAMLMLSDVLPYHCWVSPCFVHRCVCANGCAIVYPHR
ncbi:MAG: hypothetical protein ACI9UN_003405 [Granulosicoccus sp.]|jgi:hypothetical protein